MTRQPLWVSPGVRTGHFDDHRPLRPLQDGPHGAGDPLLSASRPAGQGRSPQEARDHGGP